ncbi:MAG: hypothetical protein PHV62_00310 [Sulfuricurvum sp.]|nr:hypothetical protein [Sulfuricurvum sp.]
MDKITLVFVMAGLLLLFIALVSIYVWSARKKAAPINSEAVMTFETMCEVINKNSSSNAQINHAVDAIIERYSHIDDFRVYGALLEMLCTHPQTDSKVILRFQKALITANQDFKDQIEKRLKLGLAGRK